MKIILSLCILCFSLQLFGQNVHVLKKNETLYQLSRLYNVSVDEIIQENNISDPTLLQVGTSLKIPGRQAEPSTQTTTYTIVRGDTLFSVARAHNTTARELARINNIAMDDLLRVDQVLRVPSTSTDRQVRHTAQPTDVANRGPFFWPHNGPRESMNGKLTGIQFNGKAGDTIYSVSSGVVIWSEPYRGFGNMLIVESPDNLLYIYGGNSDFSITVGDEVKPGSQLGRLSSSQSGNEARLFFSIYRNGEPQDPERVSRQ